MKTFVVGSRCLVAALAAILANSASAAPAPKAEKEAALPPAIQPKENTASWVLPRVSSAARDIAANESRHFEVVMVGDSITECWKYGRGKDVQKKALGDFRVLNLGISGDTTRNVLWRFDQGFLDGYTADVFQLMISTNNGKTDSPEDVKAGVAEIIRRIREKHPESKVLLLPIFHMASPRATAVRESRNTLLKELVDGESVIWHDFNARFHDMPNGGISKDMLYDGQHPNVRAHEIWAEEVRPIFSKIVAEARARRKTVTVELAPGGDLNAAVLEVNSRRSPGDRGEIVLADGVYPVSETVELGPAASHIVIRAKNPGKATIVGGMAFRGSDFKPVDDASVLERLPAEARGKALWLELPEPLKARFETARHTGTGQWRYGDWNKYRPGKGVRGFLYPNFPCLTVDSRRQELARWPNKSEWCWLRSENIVSAPKGGKDTMIKTGTGREAKWRFDGQKIAAAGWIEGWRYLDHCTDVKGFDSTTGALVLAKARVRPEYARVYFFNIPEEMDEPGEWCYDHASGRLLMMPPEGFGPGSLCAVGSTTNVLFHVTGDGIALRGLAFTAKTFHPAVVIEGGACNEVRGCRFSGMGYDCVWMAGRRNAVRDCDLEDIVSMGIAVLGGDVKTMIPALNVADNNRLRRCSLLSTSWAKGAIHLDGVGNTVSHNVVSDMVDCGIYFSGFDNLLEYNRVFDVCREFDDVGVVYSPGGIRSYGTVFRYNDLSGAPGQVEVLYYDDCTSGHEAYGNVLRNAGANSVLVGGGRDNSIHDNLILGGFTGITMDNRGLYWPGYVKSTEEKMRAAFARNWNITNSTTAIVRRFPRIVDWYTNEVPFHAYAGNSFERNVIVDPSGYASVLVIGKERAIDPKYTTFRSNLVVRTAGPRKGRDLLLAIDEVATNVYSATIPRRNPIGECRILDGTPEEPIDLGFADNPGPTFDPWPYYGYAQQNWIKNPTLYAIRREYKKPLGVKPWRKGDFTLKPDARLLKELPGFKPIPFDKIGLYRSEWRDDTED